MASKAKHKGRTWKQQHVSDIYVKNAMIHGYRSRAAFKLLQIQQQDHLLKKGMTIVDIGAAPGSWSQVAKEIVTDKGRIIAIDCLSMQPIDGVTYLQGDFLAVETMNQLKNIITDSIDVILSDIAPNLTGQAVTDQGNALRLWQAVLTFSTQVLKKNGVLLIKVFQGVAVEEFRNMLSCYFKMIKVRKPIASRCHSKEFYLVAKQFNG